MVPVGDLWKNGKPHRRFCSVKKGDCVEHRLSFNDCCMFPFVIDSNQDLSYTNELAETSTLVYFVLRISKKLP